MMHTREAIQLNNNLVGYDELALDAVYPDENVLNHGHLLEVAGVTVSDVTICYLR